MTTQNDLIERIDVATQFEFDRLNLLELKDAVRMDSRIGSTDWLLLVCLAYGSFPTAVGMGENLN